DASLDLFVGKRDRDGPRHLEIEGSEPAKPHRVPRPDKVSRLINQGIRKSSVNVQNWKYCQLEGRLPLAPGQKPIRRVKGKPPTRIRLYDGYGVVAEKLIEVIQIALCFRPHIGGVQRAALDLVLASNLKLAIERATPVRQRKKSEARFGSEDEIVTSVA